ncbi:MAG: hypothetical protein QXZ06_04415 [Candidatus Jordarchaeales archaeon]
MPLRRREELGGNKERELELGAVKEGIEKISAMLSGYMREVERRLEVLEKMFFGLERRVAEVEGRVALVERRVEERFAEEKTIRIPSSIVETMRAQPPPVAFAEKEERVIQDAAGKVESVVEEKGEKKTVEVDEEWGLAEEGKFTSVVEEFKKLLGEDSKKE